MPSYLFVESRDPFESRDVEEGYRLLAELAAQPIPVTESRALARASIASSEVVVSAFMA